MDKSQLGTFEPTRVSVSIAPLKTTAAALAQKAAGGAASDKGRVIPAEKSATVARYTSTIDLKRGSGYFAEVAIDLAKTAFNSSSYKNRAEASSPAARSSTLGAKIARPKAAPAQAKDSLLK